jgi:hypothetical protein
VAAGKINAVTGETWRSGLHRSDSAGQDYLVSPEQPWLDGFAIEKGVIRQFVAMPLGEGYSVEEQLTNEAEWGGLQISVVPLKAHVWQKRRSEWEEARARPTRSFMLSDACASLLPAQMGLAAGGKMRQVIHPDPFDLQDWDVAAADRVFITLVHAKDWKTITGEPAASEPPTAKEYCDAGLPWFEHYGKDQSALVGSAKLAGIKSVAKVFKAKTGATLPNSGDVQTGIPHAVGPGAKSRQVRTSALWDQ